MSNIVQTVPFNFDEIYQEIATKFTDKGYTDADYEGSNTAQLVTAMAYTVSMLNANTAANINETILSLAQKRDNVIQDARMLGYEIEHQTSYRYRLTLKFEQDGDFNIPRYTQFTANGKSYYYMDSDLAITDKLTYIGIPIYVFDADYVIGAIVNNADTFYECIADVLDIDNITLSNESYWRNITTQFYDTIDVVEGELNLYTDVDNASMLDITTTSYIDDAGNFQEQYFIDVPFQDVEDDGLHVYMTYIDEEGITHTKELWTKSSKLLIDKEDTFNREYVRVDNVEYRMPRIYFKLAGVGNEIRVGTNVQINVLVTNNINGEILEESEVLCTDFSTFIVNGFALISKGTLEESIESIKENAPLFYNTASRAVTKDDYKVIAEKSTLVGNAEIWGGEDEFPKRLGELFFSFKPETLSREFNSSTDNSEHDLLAPENLENYFLQDEYIRSTTTDQETGLLINPGVLDTIDLYRLPSLDLHVRHPNYVDVDIKVKIVKYVSGQTKSETRGIIFDSINTYFKDQLEDFYSEIFVSNIQKRVDASLTDITGTVITLDYKMMLTNMNVIDERNNAVENNIISYLSFPYESLFITNNDNNTLGALNTEVMPNIDTDGFLGSRYDLKVLTATLDNSGYDTDIEAPELIMDIVVFDNTISLSTKIGEYKIYNGVKKYIILDFFVFNDILYNTMDGESQALVDDKWKDSKLTLTELDSPKYINLKYPTTSIVGDDSTSLKSFKNTIPRLKTITIE